MMRATHTEQPTGGMTRTARLHARPESAPRRGQAARARSSWRWRGADHKRATAPAGPGASARELDRLGRQPGLPPELERELVVSAQQGDARARDQLVDAFIPMITSVARVYRSSPGIDRRELVQEGVVGLLRAVEGYDPTRGTPFWAYAGWWVRQAMQQLVSELTRPAVLSDRAQRQLARLRAARGELLAACGREPSHEELADRARLTLDQVHNLLTIDRAPRSTEAAVATEDGVVGTVGELLVDPLAEGEYEHVLNASEQQELVARLTELSDRERKVLRARYGLDGEEHTLRQIAERMGLSAERVRQIEQGALGKLAAATGADADLTVASA
jgi:RNA polymerase sigma factor (sigma-70 family)